MPAWALMYFIAYLAFTAWSVTYDIRNKAEPLWFSAAEVIGDACLVLAALSFWLSSIQQGISSISVVVFAVGLAILLGQSGRSFHRQIVADPELSFSGKLFVGTVGNGLFVIISAPLVFWGFKAAVLGVTNGT